MNQRSTEIVQLLSKEKDEITVSGFAEYFQVSQKTIRNDLKEINTILGQKPAGGSCDKQRGQDQSAGEF